MKRSSPGWLIGSGIGFTLTALVLLTVGLQWVLKPPRELCPLPALPVVEPVTDFVWSSDGKLLVAAQGTEVWVVDFPEQQPVRLPRFSQPINRVGWDKDGAPWLVYHGGLARLRADGTGWERFSTAPPPLVSPSGHWRAEVRQTASIANAQGRPLPRLAVRSSRPEDRVEKRELPFGPLSRFAWMDDDTLLIHHGGPPQCFRVAANRLEELCPEPQQNKALPKGVYESRTGPGETLYEWLLERQIPGFPWRSFRDRRVAVFDRSGKLLLRVPVGRRYWTQGSKFWEACKTSPNGRFVVLRAPDETLRVMELK